MNTAQEIKNALKDFRRVAARMNARHVVDPEKLRIFAAARAKRARRRGQKCG